MTRLNLLEFQESDSYGDNRGSVNDNRGSQQGSGNYGRQGPYDDRFRPGNNYGDRDRPLTSWGQQYDNDRYPLGPDDRRDFDDRRGFDRGGSRGDRDRNYRPGGGSDDRQYDRDRHGGRYGGIDDDGGRFNGRYGGGRQNENDRDSGSGRKTGGSDSDDSTKLTPPENLAEDDSFSEAGNNI